MSRLPSLYISHGSPMTALHPGQVGVRLAELARDLPTPRAIVIASAHWLARQPLVGTHPQPPTIHDFGGFPRELFELQYPAPGDPALAEEVAGRIAAAGLPVAIDPQRGLDHGAWVPLRMLRPQADIPVVPVSIQPHLGPAHQLAVGRALAPLRDEGVLIVGSGMSFHNLRARGPSVTPVADAWDRALTAAVTDPDPARRAARVADWEHLPHARFAHPEAEHLLPLMVALGAGSDGPAVCDYRDTVMGWVVSGYRFG